nr:DegT/DnrJ/EryC1/StrS family aminotransferase [Pseudoflavonifractor sp. 524-17]
MRRRSINTLGNKIITCGEGGMLTTNQEELYTRTKLLRSQGADPHKRYWHTTAAYNYCMTNLQAAVGLAQLEKMEWHLEQRQRVARLYEKYLPRLRDLVTVQAIPEPASHVYWMNSIMLSDKVSKSRDQVLEEQNIETRPLFYPMHVMPPYEDHTVECPVAESLAARGLNLPSQGEKISCTGVCCLGQRRTRLGRRWMQFIEFTDIGEFIDYPVKAYSTGMLVRLAFAVSTRLEGESLLLDEVISAGDITFQAKAKKRIFDLMDQARIMAFITHGLATMREVCNRAIYLKQGKIVLDGTPKEAADAYLDSIIVVLLKNAQSEVSCLRKKKAAKIA